MKCLFKYDTSFGDSLVNNMYRVDATMAQGSVYVEMVVFQQILCYAIFSMS